MSKKAFLAALELARAGKLDAALEAVKRIPDRGFVRKRLAHYCAQPDYREAALRLQAALAPPPVASLGPQAAPPVFAAPLPPATEIQMPGPDVDFDGAEGFLAWTSGPWDRIPPLALDALRYVDVWALVALAPLCLEARPRRAPVRLGGASPAARFAHALRLDSLAGGAEPFGGEPDRTVPLTLVTRPSDIEPIADKMATMVVGNADAADIRLAVRYVLVELLRNVLQHSADSLGAVTAAQRMGARQRRRRPMIQPRFRSIPARGRLRKSRMIADPA